MVFGGLDDLNAIRGTQASARVLAAALWTSRIGTQETKYINAVPPESQTLDGIYTQLSSWQQAQSNFFTQVQQECNAVLIAMANADTPLSQKTVPVALALLNSQMKANSHTVKSSVVTTGAPVKVGSPTGTPVFVTSAKDGKGLGLQYTVPETITFTCSQDGQVNTALAGSETFSVTSPVIEPSTLNYDWPLGSGLATSYTVVNASKNATAGTIINNGDFETYTVANTPNNWTIAVGVAGTNVFQGSAGNAFTGSSALQITLDAVPTQTELRQQFGNSAGTLVALQPDTQYALNAWVKSSPGAPGSGNLIFDLFNGSTIVNDDQGAANSLTTALNTIGTGYSNVNAVFRTPAVLPATAYLRIRLSGAVAGDSGKSVFVDRLGFAPMTQLSGQSLNSGIWVAVFSSNTNLVVNDTFTIQTNNTWGLFQRWLQRIFNLTQLGIVINNSGANDIPDSLIA